MAAINDFFTDALYAAESGGTIRVPTGESTTDTTITINKSVTVDFGSAASIRMTDTNKALLNITANNVTLLKPRLTGPQSASQNTSEMGIKCEGASAASPITGLKILGGRIYRWGMYGAYLHNVTDFVSDGVEYWTINHGGLYGSSVIRGQVTRNHVDDMVGTAPYGMSFSRHTDNGDLSVEPRSSDILVSRNLIEDCPNWHGLDTHSGSNIRFFANTLRRCRSGIAIGGDTFAEGITPYGAINCKAHDNIIDSGNTTGNSGANPAFGVCITGVIDGGAAVVARSTGCEALRNTIYRHGASAQAYDAAIYCHTTSAAVVSKNKLIEPSPQGVNFYTENQNFVCEYNEITDAWTNTGGVGFAVGLVCWGANNPGVMRYNKFIRGSKSATYLFNDYIRTRQAEGGYETNVVTLLANEVVG